MKNFLNRLSDTPEDTVRGKFHCEIYEGVFDENYVCKDYVNYIDAAYGNKNANYWDEAYGCWRVLPQYRYVPPVYPANSCYYCRYKGDWASGRGCDGKLRCHKYVSVQITDPGAIRDCFE
ncbi:MAG: hypothetical protein LBV20_07565 [Treponema sp.]|jgi:hypothetical protein|nr:hypothetical protein [Treponema sp.]